MTKRRSSSPYPHPPSDYVRAVMRGGWRRCDAEAIDVVRLALRNADNAEEVRSWAVRAGKALATEPVVAGAVHRLWDEGAVHRLWDEGADVAAFRLLIAAPEEQKMALAWLANGLSKAALAERVLERRYLESLSNDELDEVRD